MLNKYSDIVKIYYGCTNNNGHIYVHKNKILKTEYFGTLLELSDGNELKITFDFTEETFLYVVDVFYGDNELAYINSFDRLYEIIRAFLFFDLKSEINKTLQYFFDNNLKVITHDDFAKLEEILFGHELQSIVYLKMLLHFFNKLPKNVQEKYDDIIIILSDSCTLIKVSTILLDDTHLSPFISSVEREDNCNIILRNEINPIVYLSTKYQDTIFFNRECVYYDKMMSDGKRHVELYTKQNDKYHYVGTGEIYYSGLYYGCVYASFDINFKNVKLPIYLHFYSLK